jgi:hypothetical protein
VWWDIEVDERKLRTVHYRGLCRVIIQELHEIDNNWRNGNFKETARRFSCVFFSHVTIGNDCIANLDFEKWDWDGEKRLEFLDRKSLEVESSMTIPDGSLAATNAEIVVVWDKKNVKILDTDGQLISELQELDEDERISWNLASCCISGDRMAVLSQNEGQEKLSLWNVSDPSKLTRLMSEHFNCDLHFDLESSMKMDDQYIAISTFHNETTRFYFFSLKTLNLQWQKTVIGNIKDNFVYDKGMLLLYVVKQSESEKYGLIEMYDVTSGHCFREMHTSVKGRYELFKNQVGFNSKFMVIAEVSKCRKRNSFFYPVYKLNIYDLKAIKNDKSADDVLVSTLDLKGRPCYIEDDSYLTLNIMMDESEIFCFDNTEINIFNFGSLECFRNEANSVILSLPWRSVWRSKGVDEEPLEPVHHMEVYREVLKYFDELSMNCRTAIKTHCLNNVDPTTFIFGDDFIGFRPYNSKMTLYDENMGIRHQEIKYKIVQISLTTHLSVMGKTIHLIDSSTGEVIKERKLKRKAGDWHFNGNLLVCVCQIIEHEHLLSVWRIENSVNLTHIKDLTIDDYDGSVQVDEMFITVETCSDENAETNTYNFISMKTFQVERSLSFRANSFSYDKGYLFLQNKNLIRILNVP